MANKKKATTEVIGGTSDLFTADIPYDVVKDSVIETFDIAPATIPSALWGCVETSTAINTYAMNLPAGCAIMAVYGGKPVIQYVTGIHYDEASRRFTV